MQYCFWRYWLNLGWILTCHPIFWLASTKHFYSLCSAVNYVEWVMSPEYYVSKVSWQETYGNYFTVFYPHWRCLPRLRLVSILPIYDPEVCTFSYRRFHLASRISLSHPGKQALSCRCDRVCGPFWGRTWTRQWVPSSGTTCPSALQWTRPDSSSVPASGHTPLLRSHTSTSPTIWTSSVPPLPTPSLSPSSYLPPHPLSSSLVLTLTLEMTLNFSLMILAFLTRDCLNTVLPSGSHSRTAQTTRPSSNPGPNSRFPLFPVRSTSFPLALTTVDPYSLS